MGALSPGRISIEHGAAIGRYRLISLLGTGGMAEVWQANVEGPAGFARTVVLKRVLPHLARDPQFVEMFVQEARLSALLDHPNIVKIYELGHEANEYFITMEHVRGCDLSRILRRGAPMPIGMAAAIVHAICRALGYAHSLTDESGSLLQLVHRDVNPSNVMIGRDGTIKLFDFGIAKALAMPSALRTETGTLKGKRGYMAPEQIRGGSIDHRVDIFAAGVMLHELLTSQRLFRGATDYQTLEMILSRTIQPPSASRPDVPPMLDEICLRALDRDPARRFSSADEMADALAPYALQWDASRIKRQLAPHFLEQELAQTPQPGQATETEPPNAATVADVEPHVEGDLGSDLERLAAPRRSPTPWLFASAALLVGAIATFSATHRSAPHTIAPEERPASAALAVEGTAPTLPVEPRQVPNGGVQVLGPPSPAMRAVPPMRSTQLATKRAPVGRGRKIASMQGAERAEAPGSHASPGSAFDPESARIPR